VRVGGCVCLGCACWVGVGQWGRFNLEGGCRKRKVVKKNEMNVGTKTRSGFGVVCCMGKLSHVICMSKLGAGNSVAY